jgi:propanol-preferring alcohol dehydrogenase
MSCSVSVGYERNSHTRRDGEEFLQLSARYGIAATTHPYPMARAQDALFDLAHGRFGGAAVLYN